MDPSIDEGASDPGFLSDAVRSIAVLRRAPLLFVLTISIQILETLMWSVPFVGLAIFLTLAGWPGVQRSWYMRAFHGVPIRIGEIPRLLRAFFGRFVALGLLVGIPITIVVLALGAATYRDPDGPRILITLTLVGTAMDLLLTFVTPALTFTTAHATDALRVGLRLLRDAWPAAAAYILVPPLALEIVVAFNRAHVTMRFAGSIVSVVIALICKGATARFYVRHQGITDPTWMGNQPLDGSLPPPPEIA